MPQLKDVHEKIDEIPEPYRELYTEKGGKFELTGIAGIKTSADVARVQSALEKERNEHKATKEAAKAWGDMKPDEVQAKLDRIAELEAAAKGKIDDSKLEEMVNTRLERTLKTRLAPVEREAAQTKAALAEAAKERDALKAEKISRIVGDAVRQVLVAEKVVPDVHDDVLLLADRVFELTEEGKIITREGVPLIAGMAPQPGLDPASWLKEISGKRPSWWPESKGSGAKGSGNGGGGNFGGANPWSHEAWNMGEQKKYLEQHGEEKAQARAKAAGTTVGGLRPPPKKA